MTPSPWLEQSRALVQAAAALGPVVDLACGRGRNALAVAGWGTRVIGIDRNPDVLNELAGAAHRARLPVQCVRADLEAEFGFPLKPRSCGAILVFRFLCRRLAPRIVEALAPGGLLLTETFTLDHRQFGYGPTREAFLLAAGELPTLFPELVIDATWEGVSNAGPRPEAVARLRAFRHSSLDGL
ncbi:MAG: class I SAM-dependent methyltransferase [Deltaproteobacteria bacterium]|nr:class I SAM-dependent methyltransferase [Deltaproteobacteria bacterium]MBW2360292.1 class I SAM-dependent methyltransferase [Deltaproteobacteria bacterium]